MKTVLFSILFMTSLSHAAVEPEAVEECKIYVKRNIGLPTASRSQRVWDLTLSKCMSKAAQELRGRASSAARPGYDSLMLRHVDKNGKIQVFFMEPSTPEEYEHYSLH